MQHRILDGTGTTNVVETRMVHFLLLPIPAFAAAFAVTFAAAFAE